MLKYMLDTNTVIYTMRNRPRQVKERFQRQAGRMCVSAVTLGELVFGAHHSSQPERNLADIEAMISRLEFLPFDGNAAYHLVNRKIKIPGTLSAARKRAGQGIP